VSGLSATVTGRSTTVRESLAVAASRFSPENAARPGRPWPRGKGWPRQETVLPHGVKEFLVEKVRDWPGVHAARALLDDQPLEGLWFDRTQEYGARRRGEEHERNRFATPETVTLSPLPCWEHLSPEDQKENVAELVREIEEEAAAQREATGKTVLGRAEVLKQHPHQRPNRPAPFLPRAVEPPLERHKDHHRMPQQRSQCSRPGPSGDRS